MNGKPISAPLIHDRVSLIEWHEGFIDPGFEHQDYNPFYPCDLRPIRENISLYHKL